MNYLSQSILHIKNKQNYCFNMLLNTSLKKLKNNGKLSFIKKIELVAK